MSSVKNRSVHSPAFKAKLGLEALRGVKLPSQIGQEHGVHPVLVGQWKKVVQEGADRLFDVKRGVKPADPAHSADTEYKLYARIGRLEMELAWLKKKSGL